MANPWLDLRPRRYLIINGPLNKNEDMLNIQDIILPHCSRLNILSFIFPVNIEKRIKAVEVISSNEQEDFCY